MSDINLRFLTEADTAGAESLKSAIDSLKGGIDNLTASLGQHTQAAHTAEESTSALTEKMKDMVKEAAAGVVGFEALKKTYESIREATDKAEEAHMKIGFALQAVGKYSAETVEGLHAQAEAMGEQHGVGTATVEMWQAYALQIGVLPGNVNRVVGAADDMNRVFGIDQKEAIHLVMQAVNGHGRALKQLIPDFDVAAAKAGGFDNVMKQLAGVHGMAEAALKTHAGQVRAFQGAMENMEERVGQAILGDGGLGQLSKWVDEFGKGFQAFVGIVSQQAKVVASDIELMGSQIGAGFKFIRSVISGDGVKQAWEEFKNTTQGNLKDYQMELHQAGEDSQKEIAKIAGPTEAQKKKAADSLKELNQLAKLSAEELAKIHRAQVEEQLKMYADMMANGAKVVAEAEANAKREEAAAEKTAAGIEHAGERERKSYDNSISHLQGTTAQKIALLDKIVPAHAASIDKEIASIKKLGLDSEVEAKLIQKLEEEKTDDLTKGSNERVKLMGEEAKKAAEITKKEIEEVGSAVKSVGHKLGSDLGTAVGDALQGKTVDVGKMMQQTLIGLVSDAVTQVVDKIVDMGVKMVTSTATAAAQTVASVGTETTAYYGLAAAEGAAAAGKTALEVAHEGGVIGESGLPTRSIHADFGRLPRAHSGATVGGDLGADEVPAILQRGEVVTRASAVQQWADMMNRGPQPGAGGGGGHMHVHVQAMDASSFGTWLGTGEGGKALRRLATSGIGWGGVASRNMLGTSK